jgi:hypothetical protein
MEAFEESTESTDKMEAMMVATIATSGAVLRPCFGPSLTPKAVSY